MDFLKLQGGGWKPLPHCLNILHIFINLLFQTCDRLDKWAEKLNLKVSEVTTAVKVAIATGKDLVHGLVKFVREYLAEKLSCENVLSKPVS